MKRQDQSKQVNQAKKRLKKFTGTLQAMNQVFYLLKDLEEEVTPEMVIELSPVALPDDIVEMMVKDLNEYGEPETS